MRAPWDLVAGASGAAEVPPDILDRLASRKHGTAVIWERLDRLAAAGGDVARALDRLMDEAADNLALTFHRFLSGEIIGSVQYYAE